MPWRRPPLVGGGGVPVGSRPISVHRLRYTRRQRGRAGQTRVSWAAWSARVGVGAPADPTRLTAHAGKRMGGTRCQARQRRARRQAVAPDFSSRSLARRPALASGGAGRRGGLTCWICGFAAIPLAERVAWKTGQPRRAGAQTKVQNLRKERLSRPLGCLCWISCARMAPLDGGREWSSFVPRLLGRESSLKRGNLVAI